MKLFLLLTLSLGFYVAASAQQEGERSFALTYQNDYFTATDYYFTQGVRLEYTTPGLHRWPLARLLPVWQQGQQLAASFFVAQDGYTPTSIRDDTIRHGDRPYAGVLYLGQTRTSYLPDGRWRLHSELRLGVIGPLALSGQEQEWIHRQTGNVEPMGWQYQIENDVVANYHLTLDHVLWRTAWAEATGGAHVWLGTYQDRVGVQTQVAVGRFRSDYEAAERRPGFSVRLFGRGQLRMVGYEATLQGGLFNRSSVYTLPGSQIERIVGLAEGGVQLSFWGLRLDFSHTHLTPEFKGGRRHAWGTARITMAW